MAELVTRLKLDDKQFNDNIRKSKQQIQQFQASAKAVGTALKTFAVALIGIETAAQAFNKVIRGSQGISDEYDKVMRAATTTVDEFFTALSTGDFTSFQMGLSGIITKAKEAQAALDKLGNATMSYSYFDTKYSAELEDAINKAKDLKLSQAERDKAKETAQLIIGKQEEITKELQKSINNALSSVMTEGNLLDASSVGKIDLEDVLLLDITAKGENNKAKLAKLYDEYKKIAVQKEKEFTTRSAKVSADGAITYVDTVDTKAYLAAMQPINNQYKQAILYNEILVKKGDDWLQNTIKMAQQLDSSNRKLTEMKNKTLELTNKDVTNKTTTTTVTVKPQFQQGSLGYLEKQIQDKQLEFKYATDITSRNRIKKEIDELTKQKRYIELEYTMSQPLQPSKTSFASMVEMPDFKNVKLGEVTKGINNETKKGVKNLDAYCSALNAASNATSAFINNKFEDSGEGWTQWSANVLASIGSTIAALQALCMAEGVKSVFKLPFPANIAAIATVLAAITSAFAAFPAFADGGIFQSYLTTGDKNLARLNGGEMILNKGQQANLFNLLDKGTPLGNGGNVIFKIEGKQLVGVLNNYNNKRSKVL